MSDDRTEPASPRRRRKAREEGQVARSSELVSCVILLAVLLALPAAAPGAAAQVTDYCIHTIAAAGEKKLDADTLRSAAGGCFLKAGAVAAPVLGLVAAAALAGNVLQVGFFVNPKSFEPKWSYLNPFQGLQRLFSPRSLVE